MLNDSPYRTEVATALRAVSEAGAAVKDLYDREATRTTYKGDGSPVTDADLAADAIIRRVLLQHSPDDAILTEEGADDAQRLDARRVWIADPIDGTEQFVARTGNFDIFLALAVDGRPVVAVSLQPATGLFCLAVAGGGAWVGDSPDRLRRLVLDEPPPTPRIGTAIWFGAPENLPGVERVADSVRGVSVGASEIGFTPRLWLTPRQCDLLVGYRVGPSQRMAAEWDFAVGDLFLHEAGGLLTDLAGRPIAYNTPGARLENGFVAAVSPALHAPGLAAVRRELGKSAALGSSTT